MMKEQRKVYGYKFNNYWGYTRTIVEYWQTSMDLLGSDPKIKLNDWGIRTNLEHRGIRDCQPTKIGKNASIQDSMIYNGCFVDGRVENSILFPGVHIKKGANVKNSVLFFNNIVGEDSQIDRAVSDVNNTFGQGVQINAIKPTGSQKTTVIGWNNIIPTGTSIGSGSTVYPYLKKDQIPTLINPGEVVR